MAKGDFARMIEARGREKLASRNARQREQQKGALLFLGGVVSFNIPCIAMGLQSVFDPNAQNF